MIDINKAKIYFKEYVKKYDCQDIQIKLKIAHIERVADIAKKLATSLGLSKEDIELAELIGLLHDIGRFEQVKRYHTFIDKISVNHGVLGVEILFNDGEIRNFIEDNTYDDIIKNAILNHNRKGIDKDLNERELLHAKIIRDSDKMDIMYVLSVDETKACYGVEDFTDQKFTESFYEAFFKNEELDYKDMNNEADVLIAHFAYIFNIYFEFTYKWILEHKYIDTMYNRYVFKDKDTMEKYTKLYNEAIRYLNSKL